MCRDHGDRQRRTQVRLSPVTHDHCEPVMACRDRNITVSVPDDVYRADRIRAAAEGRSISGIVSEYSRSLSGTDREFARWEAQQRRIQAQNDRFRATDRLARDEVHDGALR